MGPAHFLAMGKNYCYSTPVHLLSNISEHEDDDAESSGTDDLNINPEEDQFEEPDIGKLNRDM